MLVINRCIIINTTENIDSKKIINNNVTHKKQFIYLNAHNIVPIGLFPVELAEELIFFSLFCNAISSPSLEIFKCT